MITPKKITIDDKNIFNEYYNMCGYKNSEANFTNMFIWKDGYDMEHPEYLRLVQCGAHGQQAEPPQGPARPARLRRRR